MSGERKKTEKKEVPKIEPKKRVRIDETPKVEVKPPTKPQIKPPTKPPIKPIAKEIINPIIETNEKLKRSENKYVRVASDAKAEEKKVFTEKVQKGELKFACYGIDGDKGYHYYLVIKK